MASRNVDVPPDQVENRKTHSERTQRDALVRGGTMERGGWRPSPLTVGVTFVVAAATVLGFVLTNHSVASQNQALLKSDTTQAAEYVSSIVSTIGAPLEALASGVTLTNGSPTEFAAQAKQVAEDPYSVILARKTPTGFVVTSVVG